MIGLNELMTPKPFTLFENQTVLDARTLMSEKNIRHIPIVNKDNILAGIFTQRDLFAVMESRTLQLSQDEQNFRESQIPLSDVMTHNPTFATTKAPLREVALYLQKEKYGCMPILKKDKLVGLITDSDFVSVAIDLIEQIEQSEPLETDH